MITKFSVKDADLDAGFCTLVLTGPDNVTHEVKVDTTQIAVSADDTELQLKHTLGQIASMALEQLYPAPKPKPLALLEMVGKNYEV